MGINKKTKHNSKIFLSEVMKWYGSGAIISVTACSYAGYVDVLLLLLLLLCY
jgi:hypothetical protein